MSRTVYLTTLGCPKNRIDSEKTLAALMEAGAVISMDIERADILLVNTCGFVTGAKEESIERVLELVEVKNSRAGVKLAVMGCLSQRYRDELKEKIPEIDHIFGVHELGKVIDELLGIDSHGKPMDPEKLTGRTLTTPRGWAFLKIAEGCSNICSFCAIPSIRGPYISRDDGLVVSEAKSLARMGVKELNLVAQDTTLYGADLEYKDGLAGLLRRLEQVEGIEWIRVMYMNPPLINDNLLETMASIKKVAPYFDIPFQHASDKILKLMKRKETGRSIRDLVGRVRSAVPGAAIRSSFIVGFPGETQDDFEELIEFLAEAKLDHVGAFIYSPEEGTPAFKMKAKPAAKAAQERLDRLMAEQRLISTQLLERHVGQNTDVLVEGVDPDENLLIGRTAMQAPEVDGCVILDGVEAEPGDMINLRITCSTDYDLIGAAV